MNFKIGANRLKQCLLLLFICQASAFSSAAPVQWRVEDGGNGSWYEIYQNQPDAWETVYSAASRLKHGQLNGSLASVTSAEENRFILDNVARPYIAASGQETPRFWLGGNGNSSARSAVQWRWIHPWEEWRYTNWSPLVSEESGTRLSMDANGLWHAETIDAANAFAIIEYSLNAVQWRVEDGGNGHWYRLVSDHDITTWEEQDSHARMQTYGAFSGHLATIDNKEENTFLTDALLPRLFEECGFMQTTLASIRCGEYNAWPRFAILGGRYIDGEWRWSTGEPWNYDNWAMGQAEPENNAAAVLLHPGHGNSDGLSIGQWYSDAKMSFEFEVRAYIIEYETAEDPGAFRPAHYCNQSEDHCRYRYYLDQPGFYVVEAWLPTGLGDGGWGLSVSTSGDEYKGGFCTGSTLEENGAAPGVMTFYLTRREAVRLTVQEYSGLITELTVKLERQETDGTRTVVYGPALQRFGQTYTTPEFEPGFYIAEVFSDAASRVRFGISINAASMMGEVNISGWIDSETGGNGAGFNAIYIDHPQMVDLKLLYRRNYGFNTAERGDEGAERPHLALYRQVDAERELLWRPRNEPAAPVAVIELPTRTNELDMRFSQIPASSFTMGAVDQYGERNVTLTRPFYLQTTETTRAQWQAVTGENRWEADNCPLCPANQVSWNEVRDFIALLNGAYTGEYRLPTEAEWEYAARAGGAEPNFYPEGERERYGWCEGFYISGIYESGPFPFPAAEKLPNPWGLYDIVGNADEWVNDNFDRNYYTAAPLIDPQGPAPNAEGETLRKVYRGTCCRSDYTDSLWASAGKESLGFRLVWEPLER